MSNLVINVRSFNSCYLCNLGQIVSFMSNHVIHVKTMTNHVKSAQFMSNHVDSSQIMSLFMSFVFIGHIMCQRRHFQLSPVGGWWGGGSKSAFKAFG
jgi:hypothetical protein